VRQGEVAKGAWIGNPLGGVKAPEALILPDPMTRFARSAARLEALSAGHPMTEWLRFMARLAQAQHAAATALGPFAGPSQAAVEQAVEAHMPPLAADGHRRDAAWRDGLNMLLDHSGSATVPAPAQAVMASLRNSEAGAVESLADRFLRGAVDAGEAGAALYVAAALQVYFTRLAAELPLASLRLLPRRGLCPCCGSTPVAGVVVASGQTSGARYLYCSLCAAAWNHVRAELFETAGHRITLSLNGRQTRIGSFPVGIDPRGFQRLACRNVRSSLVKNLVASLGGRDLMIGVDRLDYSKGLIQRLDAFDIFLTKHSEWIGKVTYLQIAPKNRSEIPEYAELAEGLGSAAGRINGKYGEVSWTPIRYVNRVYSRSVLAGLYRTARVGLVTPLRDGMNLVAKEYVAAQDADEPGVLVLSRFAGAAIEFRRALLVNPYDAESVAAAIAQALTMPLEERRARHDVLLAAISEYDVERWQREFLAALRGDDGVKYGFPVAAHWNPAVKV
jgi:FdhE protein